MVQMTVLTASVFIVHIVVAPACRLIERVVTAITAENIFRPRLNGMQFPYRSRIIYLESLLHRIRLSVRMIIFQPQSLSQFVFLFVGKYIQINIVRIISLRLRIYLIG